MATKKTLCILLLCCSAITSFSQQRPTQAPSDTSKTAIPGGPAAATGARTSPRPYKDVITNKAISQKGLFTVHKVEDKFYFEIPDSVMFRELCVTVN